VGRAGRPGAGKDRLGGENFSRWKRDDEDEGSEGLGGGGGGVSGGGDREMMDCWSLRSG